MIDIICSHLYFMSGREQDFLEQSHPANLLYRSIPFRSVLFVFYRMAILLMLSVNQKFINIEVLKKVKSEC
jgi:hypothetical protein